MGKDPAFLFYSSDFMMGSMLLSMEERGQYITLLSVMHQQGRLSYDEVEIVIKSKPSQRLASKFKIDENNMWFSERLEDEISKRKKFTESRRNSLRIDNNDMVHIYLLLDPKTKKYKIGSSKYPNIRLMDAQKRNPDITLFWKSEELVVRITEKKLHDEFVKKKFKNDWFSLSEDDLQSIINREIFRTGSIIETRTESRTEDENENENTISSTSLIKSSIEDAIFKDEIFMGQLRTTHPGKNYLDAWNQCWSYFIQQPSPPSELWQWKQKLTSWLTRYESKGKSNQYKKGQFVA